MNKEIKKLHQQLIKTHKELSLRLGKTSDIDEADAILREMEEVNFRVMMAGRLLFKETTISFRCPDKLKHLRNMVNDTIADSGLFMRYRPFFISISGGMPMLLWNQSYPSFRLHQKSNQFECRCRLIFRDVISKGNTCTIKYR